MTTTKDLADRDPPMRLARLLACLCIGAGLIAGCATSGYAPTRSSAKCDPTGSSEARQSCNR
jgi:hypothetical protein